MFIVYLSQIEIICYSLSHIFFLDLKVVQL